jgi:hypothetical protein
MLEAHFRQCRRFVALATFPILLTLGGVAKAQPDEAAPTPPTEAEAPPSPPPKAEPVAATPTPGAEAPGIQAQAPFFEEMGPESYPSRLRGGDGIIATLSGSKGIEEAFSSGVRGIHGGSLWLEPTFHGLQWPHNSRTGIGVSGSFWVDSGYETIARDATPLTTYTLNSKMTLQQGRGVLRVTPTFVSGRLFVQGQAELVGNLCQGAGDAAGICPYAGTFTTDDLWVRVGQWNLWDLKVGRFEGWEVYHLGMGMDPYTLERKGAGMFGVDNSKWEAPSLYRLNFLGDRATDGQAVGYAAFHAYLTQFFRLELLGKLGTNKSMNINSDNGGPAYTYFGGRPTAIFDIGWLRFKVGAEYQKRNATTQTPVVGSPVTKMYPVGDLVNKGIGASLQFVVDPVVEFGVNGAYGTQNESDNMGKDVPENDLTTKSLGGFANVRVYDGLMAGVGVNWTEQTDSFKADNSKANDYTSHLQGFVAVQYLLAGQLYIKAVFGYADAKFQPSDTNIATWENKMYSGRVRLMYMY